MKKLLVTGFFIVSLLSCNSENKTDKKMSQKDSEIASKVENLISQMTLDEKIAEMTQDAPANERLGIPYNEICRSTTWGLACARLLW